MDWARKINARVIQIIHIEQRRTYLISSPNYLPKSIRKHKFKLDSKPILEGNKEMVGLCVDAKTVVRETKENLRTIIRETQNLEERVTKEMMRKEFAIGIKDIFTFSACYFRSKQNMDFIHSTTNEEAEILTTSCFMQHFIHTKGGKEFKEFLN